MLIIILYFFHFLQLAAGQGGCEFNDDQLLDQSSNDYTGFKEDVSYRWDDHNNVIPYSIQKPIREQNDSQVIRDAMDMFKRMTNNCIEFFEVNANAVPPHHLHIFIEYVATDEEQGTSGFVDYGNGKKDKTTMHMINTGPEGHILDELIVLHELGHVLGLAHTHKRYDRDQHVDINWDCIQKNMTSQFKLHTQNELKIFDEIPYMCNSMMHYGPTTWHKKNKDCNTIIPKSPECKEQGLGGKPIKEDWDLIKLVHCEAHT